MAAGLGHKVPGSFNGMPHLGEHLHGGAELPAEKKWVIAGAINPIKHKARVDLAGHFPPLAALMELGSSSLPSWWVSLSSSPLTAPPPPATVAKVEAWLVFGH